MSVEALSSPPRPIDPVTFRRRGTGLLAHDPARAGEGYTLYAPQTGGGVVWLVDMAGEKVHRWQMPCRPGRHAVLLRNGNLGYNGYIADTPDHYAAWMLWHGGHFIEATPTGEIVWEHRDPFHHHDGQWLANGHLLYSAMAPIPADIARRIVGGSPAHDRPDGVVFGDVIKEVDRSGAIVWEWRVWEHLVPEDFPIHPNFDRYHWPMINGLGVTRDGLVLMSLRTTSGVIGVDRATGDVKVKLAYPTFCQQHTPVELDDGSILAFDNGNLRPGVSVTFSRALAVDPKTGTIAWSYADAMKAAFFSPYMGAVQRLPNGNTHITESHSGRLFDVTPEGDVVWEYVIPDFAEYSEPATLRYSPGATNSVFRSYRYQPQQVPWL